MDKLKLYLFSKSYPVLSSSLPPSPSQLKTPSTIVAVCLPDSLDLTPSGYRFCFGQAPVNRALAESRDFAFVGAVEISSLRYHYDIDLHDTIVLQRKVSPLRNVYYICPICPINVYYICPACPIKKHTKKLLKKSSIKLSQL